MAAATPSVAQDANSAEQLLDLLISANRKGSQSLLKDPHGASHTFHTRVYSQFRTLPDTSSTVAVVVVVVRHTHAGPRSPLSSPSTGPHCSLYTDTHKAQHHDHNSRAADQTRFVLVSSQGCHLIKFPCVNRRSLPPLGDMAGETLSKRLPLAHWEPPGRLEPCDRVEPCQGVTGNPLSRRRKISRTIANCKECHVTWSCGVWSKRSPRKT